MGVEKVDVRKLWQQLRRGKRLILLTTVVGTALAYLVIKQLAPLYTASASVMLETRHRNITEAEAVLPGLTMAAEVIEGEVEVLYSREMADDVVAKLNLLQNPEFNLALRSNVASFLKSFSTYLLTEVARYAQRLSAVILDFLSAERAAYARYALDNLTTKGTAPTELQAAALLKKQVVDMFLDQLDAKQVGQSPVIRISFTSEDPATASLVANALAETYIETQLDLKFAATRQANTWLSRRIAHLRLEVEEKERAIEQYRARSGLIEGKDVTVATQQMSELASQLVVVRVDRQNGEARLQQVERLASFTNGLESAVEVLDSGLIDELRIQEAQLRHELAKLAVEYGSKHPRIADAESKLGNIQESIRATMDRIVAGLRNHVETARRREARIQTSLDQLSERVAQIKADEVQMRALEREVNASRTLLEGLLTRAQETAEQEDIQQPDARIISMAEIPEFPSFPNERLFMLLAFCASAFVGLSLAFVRQAFDQSFQTAAQARDELKLPVLELIPAVHWRRSPIDFVVRRPSSGYGEALRNLQVTLFADRTAPKKILFTSSLPREGKTVLALSLGRFLAMADRAAIVVDCDLRKPSIHNALRGRDRLGLIDHLLDQAVLDDVIQIDEDTGLHYIAAGRLASNPTNLLPSRAMQNTLTELARRYDAVILDSAPMLAVADTRCLPPLVDRTVFVIRWRATRRATALEAIRRLDPPDVSTVSVVLNRVDTKSYGLYDGGYDYEAVKCYYN